MKNRIRHFLTYLGLLLIVVMIGVFVEPSVADMYKWVDEKGVVHFSDTPPDNADRSDVETLPAYTTHENDEYPKESHSIENKDNRSNPTDTLGKNPWVKKPKVELYTTSWCPWCKKARNFFRERGIVFVEYDIEKDNAAARRKAKIDRQNGVPFAVINGIGISGYNEIAYNNALRQ